MDQISTSIILLPSMSVDKLRVKGISMKSKCNYLYINGNLSGSSIISRLRSISIAGQNTWLLFITSTLNNSSSLACLNQGKELKGRKYSFSFNRIQNPYGEAESFYTIISTRNLIPDANTDDTADYYRICHGKCLHLPFPVSPVSPILLNLNQLPYPLQTF